jgi:hypothetical protein
VRYAAGSNGVNIEEEDASRIGDLFFACYKGLARWHVGAWKLARSRAREIRTRLGRRRRLPAGAEIISTVHDELIIEARMGRQSSVSGFPTVWIQSEADEHLLCCPCLQQEN